MKDFWDYIVKNKYVIICIAIIVVLYALGIVEFLTKAVVLIVLIGVAIFIGKLLQDHEGNIKELFNGFKSKVHKEDVYYYQDNTAKNEKKEE